MRVLKIMLVALAVLGVSAGALIAYAVAHESEPLTGAALAASPEAQSYATGLERLLAAQGLRAKKHDFSIREPSLQVHAFEIEGAGPPILLIHGGGSSGLAWLPLLPELRGRHLFVVDRPGCGLTDGLDYTGVAIRPHGAAFVGAVIDALALDRPILVGNSMGGLWAIDYSLAHPERVAALALVGTPAASLGTGMPAGLRMMARPGIGQLMMLRRPKTPEQMREFIARTMGRHAAEQLSPEFLETGRSMGSIPGAGRSFRTLARALIADGGGATAAEIARLAPPVLWVWGDADSFADAGFPERAQAVLPRSKLVVVPGAGHLPWLDDPAVVGRAIAAFVDTDPRAARAAQ